MMKKISEAEKTRRKEEAIYHYSEHLLNIIWACRDNAWYNNSKWNKKDILCWIRAWSSFQKGCSLADGRKWYNRLDRQWEEYEAIHGKCTD